MTIEEVTVAINELIAKYEFPVAVLQDVSKRLTDSQCPYYAMQQLRYLQNNIQVGIATKRVKGA